MRIALAQIDSHVGNFSANTDALLAACHSAAAENVEVVVAPEMALPGYPVEDLALRASFRRAADAALKALAARLLSEGLGHQTLIVGSLGSADDGRPTNVAAVIHRGQVEIAYVKAELPNYGVFDERRIFAAGSTPGVIEVGGKRVGLAICHDIWVPDGIISTMGEIDVLIALNGSPYERGKQATRYRLAGDWARRLDAPVLYVNMVGGQDALVFDGRSFAVDAAGAPLVEAPGFTEAIIYVDLPEDKAQPLGPQADRERAQIPVESTEDAARPHVELTEEELAEMWSALRLGLHDYWAENGFSKVIIGLSGGIDSALVAALAADAVGGKNIIGVSMPSDYSSQHSRDDAADLAARIGADYRVQPISPMVAAFKGQMDITGVAEENLQARCRGVILMAISNSEGGLVLAPGNKSELAVGYSTMYGDSVGGFAPIKDVLKTQVWQLARWRNAQARERGEVEPIPENSITKAPSAELRPDQVDQDSLPPYDQLDAVIDGYVVYALGRDELIELGHEPAVVDRALTLIDRAEWKRRQYAIGPKVSLVAFGRDRRLPVTNGWREAKAGQ